MILEFRWVECRNGLSFRSDYLEYGAIKIASIDNTRRRNASCGIKGRVSLGTTFAGNYEARATRRATTERLPRGRCEPCVRHLTRDLGSVSSFPAHSRRSLGNSSTRDVPGFR